MCVKTECFLSFSVDVKYDDVANNQTVYGTVVGDIKIPLTRTGTATTNVSVIKITKKGMTVIFNNDKKFHIYEIVLSKENLH